MLTPIFDCAAVVLEGVVNLTSINGAESCVGIIIQNIELLFL